MENYNPKRLITFKNRFIKLLENELILANLNNELDYVEWITNSIKKVKKHKVLIENKLR
jgi:hypothetical protein